MEDTIVGDARAMKWIFGMDTGVSAKTIWAVMMRVDPAWADIPHDAADFGRCYRLLKTVPEWRSRLQEVTEKYPEWGVLVACWDELESLYEANKQYELTHFIRRLR